MKYIGSKVLESENLILRPTKEEDLKVIWNILCDIDVAKYYLVGKFNYDWEKEKVWQYKKLEKAKNDKRINDDTVKSLEKIEAIVRRMATGVDSKLWNNYSNLDLNSDFIVFDIHTLLDSDDTILRTQFFNILSLCWHIISQNRDEQVILIVDEAHLLIDPENKDGLEFLKRTSKRIRKYNGSLIVCTQNMIDFTSPEVVRYGQVIVDNSDYQIIMAQGSEEIISLQKVLRLSENERRFLQTAGKGQALFVITHDRRIPIFVHLRPEEKELFGKGGGR